MMTRCVQVKLWCLVWRSIKFTICVLIYIDFCIVGLTRKQIDHASLIAPETQLEPIVAKPFMSKKQTNRPRSRLWCPKVVTIWKVSETRTFLVQMFRLIKGEEIFLIKPHSVCSVSESESRFLNTLWCKQIFHIRVFRLWKSVQNHLISNVFHLCSFIIINASAIL